MYDPVRQSLLFGAASLLVSSEVKTSSDGFHGAFNNRHHVFKVTNQSLNTKQRVGNESSVDL